MKFMINLYFQGVVYHAYNSALEFFQALERRREWVECTPCVLRFLIWSRLELGKLFWHGNNPQANFS